MKGLIAGLFTAVFVTMLANSAINHDRERIIRAAKHLGQKET